VNKHYGHFKGLKNIHKNINLIGILGKGDKEEAELEISFSSSDNEEKKKSESGGGFSEQAKKSNV